MGFSTVTVNWSSPLKFSKDNFKKAFKRSALHLSLRSLDLFYLYSIFRRSLYPCLQSSLSLSLSLTLPLSPSPPLSLSLYLSLSLSDFLSFSFAVSIFSSEGEQSERDENGISWLVINISCSVCRLWLQRSTVSLKYKKNRVFAITETSHFLSHFRKKKKNLFHENT